MERNIKLFKALLKYGFPLIFVVSPALAIYDEFFPWDLAKQELNKYGEQNRIAVGMSFNHQTNLHGSKRIVSRTYMLFPYTLNSFNTVMVHQINDNEPNTTEISNGLFHFMFSIVIAALGTWWFWFRKVEEDAT